MPREKKKKRDEQDTEVSYNSLPQSISPDEASNNEDSDDDSPERNYGPSNLLRKATSNSESVEMWFRLSDNTQEKHYHTMKINLLSPFLFDSVSQEDKWINWAHEVKLWPSNSYTVELNDENFQNVDIVEDAFDKLRGDLRQNGNMKELLDMMDKFDKVEKLEKAIILAESFTTFCLIRDKLMKPIKKDKGDVALLLAHNQVYVHVRDLTRNIRDWTEEFEETCEKGEQHSSDKKKQGNTFFLNSKYKAAISSYTRALHISPFSYILYGNRAQSYLKTKEYRCALSDGRRAVVLKPEWQKGQYRYAEALYEMGKVDRAIKANEQAMIRCKNDRDLTLQHQRFKRKQVRGIDTWKEFLAAQKRMAKGTSQISGAKEKLVNGNSDLSDLPDLVEAHSSDTDNEDLIDENSVDSSTSDLDNNTKTGHPKARKARKPSEPPELVEYSSEESDSIDTRYVRRMQSKNQLDELLKQKRRKEKEEKKRTKLAREKKEADRKQAEREKLLEEQRVEFEKRMEEKKKKQAAKQKLQLARNKDENSMEEAAQQKLRLTRSEYEMFVKEGTEAFLTEETRTAVHLYKQALELLDREGKKILGLKDLDHMLLLYVLGKACLETGLYENIQSAMKQFQKIVDRYRDKFPLAYYGLGIVYQKQNRFYEALEPLQHGLELVKKGVKFPTLVWPGSSTEIIEESTLDEFKSSVQEIINLCKNPPKADAVCRFSECSNGRTHIYFTDYDYKGFVRLICNEACNVEFHPSCWKKFKTFNEEKSGDKDFVDDTCMTPDCNAPVVKIQIHDQEGIKTEFKSDKQKTEFNSKSGPHAKVKAASQPRKKHTKEQLDETRQCDNSSEHSSSRQNQSKDGKDIDSSSQDNKDKAVHEAKENPSQLGVKPLLEDCRINDNEQPPLDPDSGVYIIRKTNAEDEGQMQGKAGKVKTKKKKPKNTQSLGEFLKDHGGEQEPLKASFPYAADDPDEIPAPVSTGVRRPPLGWNSYDEPFSIPFYLQEQAEMLEQEYRSNFAHQGQFYSEAAGSDFSKPDTDVAVVMDYLSSMLREILQANGALHISDPRIQQPLSMLPSSYQDVIEKSGGIRKLLNESSDFVFKGTLVMSREQNCLVENTEKESGFSSSLHEEIYNGGDVLSNPLLKFSYQHGARFNPEAKEFVPRSASQVSFEQETDYTNHLSSLSHHDSTNAFTLNLSPVDLGSIETSSKAETLGVLNGECNSNGTFEHISENCYSNSTNGKDELETEKSKSDALSDTQEKAYKNDELQNNFGKSECFSKQSECLATVKTDNFLDVQSDSINDRELDETGKQIKEKAPIETSTEFMIEGKLVANGNDFIKQSNGKAVANVQDTVIGSKSKGIQTQPFFNQKTKAIMTEPMQEQYKIEWHKAVAERDVLQEKIKQAESKQTYHQNRLQQETEKYKKKTSEWELKIEKLEKEREELSRKYSTDLETLEKEKQSLTIQVKTLEEKAVKDEEKYKVQQSNHAKEMSTMKSNLQSEKENCSKLAEQLAKKDEELKKLTSFGQLQQSRAQECEIKLLELRRDVGLRFLERAFQEAHLTINNLKQANNTRLHSLPPTIKELLAAWQSYVTECHSRIVRCKSSFNEQIQLVKDGRPLNTLSPLSIPGAPQYPGPPLLQQLVPPVPGQQLQHDNQLQFSLGAQKLENKLPVQTATVTEAQKVPVANQTNTSAAAAAAAAVGGRQQANGIPMMVPSGGYFPPQGKPNVVSAAQAAATAPLNSAVTQVQEPKPRPSNSFEKIMLRLSTMYPNYNRLELTGFIKEVRNNKHGSLTGLSLEDIVSSVSELVELKKKQGQLRGSVAMSASHPQVPGTNSSRSFQPPSAPPTSGAVVTSKPVAIQQSADTASKVAAAMPVAVSSMEEEEDPCVICHEDMNVLCDTVTLECGHKYHSDCIRKWLMGEQSTCPTCRVHALMPDEFPRLK